MSAGSAPWLLLPPPHSRTHLRMETLIGTAMPPPPQLLHLVQPELLQELQPTSPSDHLVQKHGCRPDPPQLGHGRLSEASRRSCR